MNIFGLRIFTVTICLSSFKSHAHFEVLNRCYKLSSIKIFLSFLCASLQVIGLNNVPVAGDVFEVVESLDTAREKAESRVMSLRDERISAKAGDGKVTLSSLASAVSSGKLSGLDLHQLNIILKVDLQVWSLLPLLLEFLHHLVDVQYLV